MMGMPSGDLQELCQDLEFEDDMMRDFIRSFMREMELGLSSDHKSSSLKCFLTYVQDIPAGYEKGQYLSLNFSSQNVTVSLITLKNRSFDLQARHFTIPEEVTKKAGDQIFDFLVQCIYEFTADSNLNMAGLPLGVTFGFPCEHKSLRSAILLEWTKDFLCSGAIGNDVVVMLEKSLSKREDLDVKILALVNDTTETLLAAMWKVRKCKLAFVVDYGTNISYVERIESIPKYKGDKSKPCMIINIEAGNLGSTGTIDYIRTQWDKDLDAKSQRPGRYLFDKMTGKEYLGEIVRRIVLSAVEKRILFKGNLSEEMSKPWNIDSSIIVEISKDWSGQSATRTLLRSLGISAPTPQECIDFKFVCQRVWVRSAHLSAAAIASVIQYMRCKQVGIAYSGGLLFENPRFLDVLRSRLRQLLDPRIQFQFVNPEGVGGLGAALAACVANTGSIAMFTERLEEPEDIYYTDTHTEDERPRRSEINKTMKGLSDTSLQLTPKKNSKEPENKRTHSTDSILKKPIDPIKSPPKLPKRRSQEGLNSRESKSNVDVVKKQSAKSTNSKPVSKELSESVSGDALKASKHQARDVKPPAAGTSGSSKHAVKQGSESVSGDSLRASKLQVKDSPEAGTSGNSKQVSKQEPTKRDVSKSRIRGSKSPAATIPKRQSIKKVPKPPPKHPARKDTDTASLHSAGQISQKSTNSKEEAAHKAKPLHTNVAGPKLQPSPLTSDRAVSNIGASGSRKKEPKEPSRNESERSHRSIASEKIAKIPEVQPRRSGINNSNRKETHPPEKAKTKVKPFSPPSREK